MHIEILEALAKAYGKDASYLEVGVGDGGCFERIIPHVRRGVAVDVPDNPYGNGRINFLCSMDRKCHFYECGSDDFFKSWEGGSFSLIFIDGSHWEDQVWKDFENARKVLSPYGTIAMHDTWAVSPEEAQKGSDTAWKVAEALEQADECTWQCFTVPVHPGLTLVRPYDSRMRYYA